MAVFECQAASQRQNRPSVRLPAMRSSTEVYRLLISSPKSLDRREYVASEFTDIVSVHTLNGMSNHLKRIVESALTGNLPYPFPVLTRLVLSSEDIPSVPHLATQVAYVADFADKAAVTFFDELDPWQPDIPTDGNFFRSTVRQLAPRVVLVCAPRFSGSYDFLANDHTDMQPTRKPTCFCKKPYCPLPLGEGIMVYCPRPSEFNIYSLK